MYEYNKEYKHPTSNPKYEQIPTLEEALALPVKAIPARGLEMGACQHFGVRVETTPEGRDKAYYFIYHEGGLPCGYKRKAVGVGKEAEYKTVGKISNKTPLFGAVKQHVGKKVWICEGETDCIALYQAIDKYSKDKGFETKNHPACCSIVTGAGNAAQNLLENIEYLKNFKEVILVFDSDSATQEEYARGIRRGKEAVADAVLALPDVSIKVVTLPLKDANDMVKAGRSKELAEYALFRGQEYLPEAITEYHDTEEEIDFLLKPLKKGVLVDFLPKTCEILHGIRPGEMTMLLAKSGAGKSSLAKQLGMSILKSDPTARVANFYLEEDLQKAKQSYLALYHGVKIAALRENPQEHLTREKVGSFLKWAQHRMAFYDCDKSGLLKPESVERMIRYCAVTGFTHIIFDHLTFVFTGSDNSTVHGIDNLLTKLSMIPRGYPVHLWVISHIVKSKYQPPKEKGKEIEYPYWEPISAEDARGSSSFLQLCWNMIVLEREILDENGKTGRVRLVVKKNREWGTLGVGDILQYNHSSGLFI